MDQALCLGATVIYVEDLAALGRELNGRISASARGQFQQALHHLGAKAGCVVVTIPPPGDLRHLPAVPAPSAALQLSGATA
ncbi:MAG: hypothetical protein ACYDC5_04280 [Candidatus Dormibacteria bacterium]